MLRWRTTFLSFQREWKQKKKSLLRKKGENKNINRERVERGREGDERGEERGRRVGEERERGRGVCKKSKKENNYLFFQTFSLRLSCFSLSSYLRCNPRITLHYSKPCADNKLL